MTIGTILGILIGLAFLYLVLSLLASMLQELAAGAWNTRGRGLQQSIAQLFDDPEMLGFARRVYGHPLVAGLVPPGISWFESSVMARLLLPFFSKRLPSYIPKETFADVVIDLLRTGKAFETGLMQPALAALWRDSGKDFDKFRDKLMAWYGVGTDRQTGRYKRKTQRWLFFYGLVIAIALNADTLLVARGLMIDGRAAQAADKITALLEVKPQLFSIITPQSSAEQSAADASRKQVKDLVASLTDVGLPIGWGTSDGCAIGKAVVKSIDRLVPFDLGVPCTSEKPTCEAQKPAETSTTCDQPIIVGAASWVGWLLTALAVSLGAQFWFETLGQLIKLRSSGKPAPQTPQPN